jgi:PiT family inorganic phosphate transporter
MGDLTVLVILVIVLALAFDFINGFHDTANAIATVVSTRVLTPGAAIAMAAVLNFAGAIWSVEVAKTISKGIVDPSAAPQTVILAAIVGAIVWNLITWKYGIPSSSSHALVGGVVGAGMAHAGTAVVQWKGVTEKVLIPVFASPLSGLIIGFVLMNIIYFLLRNARPEQVNEKFKKLQIVSASVMAFAHGMNDAQKSMGIITMALISANVVASGSAPPMWARIACAVAMAIGTSMGGWRIIQTMGHKIVRLEPVHGFAAETTAATLIMVASKYGIPLSTTHTIAGSIFGVGSSRRLSAVRWGVAKTMVMAWVLTLPASALVAAITYYVVSALGIK